MPNGVSAGERRVRSRGEARAEHGARVDGIDDAVVPEPRARVQRARLPRRIVPCISARSAAASVSLGARRGAPRTRLKHDAGLLAAHDGDARVRPGPEEPRAVRAAAHAVIAGAVRRADDHGELRHARAGHGRDELRAVLGDAAALGVFADHEARDVLQEQQRHAAAVAELDEVRGFQRGLGEQHAVVREDADGLTPELSERADERRAVTSFEFVEVRAVDDACQHFADVVLVAHVFGEDAVELLGRVLRVEVGAALRASDALWRTHAGDDVASERERVLVVVREMIRDARDARVDVAAAERLVVDVFADGGFDERRACEIDRALLLDDDRLVAHRRHVGAAGRARAHDDRDLRDAARGELGLVVEDPPEVVAVGKDLVLQRQECPAGVDEIDARQAILERDLLRAQMLLDRQRVVGAAFDGRVVGEDHAAAPRTMPTPQISPAAGSGES